MGAIFEVPCLSDERGIIGQVDIPGYIDGHGRVGPHLAFHVLTMALVCSAAVVLNFNGLEYNGLYMGGGWTRLWTGFHLRDCRRLVLRSWLVFRVTPVSSLL